MKKLNLYKKRNNTSNSSDNKDNVNKEIRISKLKKIKDALLNREIVTDTNLINITEI